PREPAVLILIEDVQRLVAQLGELGAPAGAAFHGQVVLNRADDVDLLPVVHLIPECLENLPQRRPLGVATVHQARHVREAHVSYGQFFVIEHAHAAMALDAGSVEREVDLLDAVALGAVAAPRLGARSAAAEQNAVAWDHWHPDLPYQRPSSGLAGSAVMF